MSIRVRTVDGRLVALCAAENAEEPGDLYLDDGVHVALQEKFLRDWTESGLLHDCPKETTDLRAEVASLRARLAESERAAEDQARLVGMGSEREARLMAQLSEARGLLREACPLVGPAENFAAWTAWHEKRDALLGGKEPPRE